MHSTRALIVDGDLPAALNLQLILQRLDYLVVGTVAAVADAVARVRDAGVRDVGVDVVLMSLDAPGPPDPVEAAEQIRRRHDIPVVFLANTPAAAESVAAFGPHHCVVKPVDERRLDVAIEVTLHGHRLATRLRESDERLGTFLRQSRDGIIVIDDQGIILEWNEGEEHITGISRSQALGRPIWEVQYGLLPDERKAVLTPEALKVAVASGVAEGLRLSRLIDEEVQCADGTRRSVQSLLFPIPAGDRILAGGISRDVTQNKQIEAALRRSEARFRTFFETNANYCYMVLPDGTILDANTAALSALGYTREELIGQPATRIYAPESQAQAAELFRPWQATGAVRNEELVLLTKSGGRRTVLLNAVKLEDERGEMIHSVSIQTDITERKHIEAALRESEARFRGTFDQAPAGAALMSLDYHFIRVNQTFCTITGYGEAELLEMGFPGITEPGDWALDLEEIARLAAGEIDEYAVDRQYIAKDGHRVWIRFDIRLLRDETGVPLYFLPMMKDISDRMEVGAALMKYAQELEQLDRTNQALLREINHRTKNTLSAILGLIYAERRRLTGEVQRSCGEVLADLSGRIQHLVEVQSLLSASGWRPLQLTALAEEIIAGTAPVVFGAQEALIEVRPSLVSVTPEQAHHLAMVIGELAMNSVKYGCADEQLRIALDVEREDDQVCMTYRDRGVGYPDAVIAGGSRSVGLGLLNSLVTLSLRGTWSIRNDGGAITEIRFPIAPV